MSGIKSSCAVIQLGTTSLLPASFLRSFWSTLSIALKILYSKAFFLFSSLYSIEFCSSIFALSISFYYFSCSFLARSFLDLSSRISAGDSILRLSLSYNYSALIGLSGSFFISKILALIFSSDYSAAFSSTLMLLGLEFVSSNVTNRLMTRLVRVMLLT
jgi:hypothetical protein